MVSVLVSAFAVIGKDPDGPHSAFIHQWEAPFIRGSVIMQGFFLSVGFFFFHSFFFSSLMMWFLFNVPRNSPAVTVNSEW